MVLLESSPKFLVQLEDTNARHAAPAVSKGALQILLFTIGIIGFGTPLPDEQSNNRGYYH